MNNDLNNGGFGNNIDNNIQNTNVNMGNPINNTNMISGNTINQNNNFGNTINNNNIQNTNVNMGNPTNNTNMMNVDTINQNNSFGNAINNNIIQNANVNMNSMMNSQNEQISMQNNNFSNSYVNNQNMNSVNDMYSVSNNYTVNETPQNETKKSGKGLLIGVLVAIVLIIVGVGTYFVISMTNKPKNIFLVNMLKFKNVLENKDLENFQNIYSNLSDGFTYKFDGDVYLEYNKSKLYDGKVKLDLISNPSSKELYFNGELIDKENNKVSLDSIWKNNKIYFKIKDVFDDYYYTNLDYINIFEKVNIKYDVLLDCVLKSVEEYLKETEFKTSDEKIDVNGKKITVTKTSLVMTEKGLTEIAISVINNIITNEKALTELTNIINIEEDVTTAKEIKGQLEETVKGLKEEDTSDDVTLFEYNMYTKKSELLKQELVVNDEFKLVIDGNNSGTYSVIIDNETVLTGKFDSEKVTFEFNLEEEDFYFSGTLTKNNFKLKANDGTENNSITLEYNYNYEFKNNNYSDNINVKLDAVLDGEKILFNGTFKSDLNDSKSIPSINVSNAKNIEELSTEEVDKLSQMPIIGSIFAFSSPSYPSYSGTLDIMDDNFQNYDEMDDMFGTLPLYNTFVNFNHFDTLVKSSSTNMIVFGRKSCTYCTKYIDTINKVVNKNALIIYYIDSENFNSSEYNKVINSDLVVPKKCGISNKDFKLNEDFGTPLTIFTKSGQVVDCIRGYVEENELTNKLKELKMIN